jgi:hypothetical protein
MFDSIGDVYGTAIDLCFVKTLIEEFSGRPNKRMPLPIFLIAGCSLIIIIAAFGRVAFWWIANSPNTAWVACR